jgi:hypothetical protein
VSPIPLFASGFMVNNYGHLTMSVLKVLVATIFIMLRLTSHKKSRVTQRLWSKKLRGNILHQMVLIVHVRAMSALTLLHYALAVKKVAT